MYNLLVLSLYRPISYCIHHTVIVVSGIKFKNIINKKI